MKKLANLLSLYFIVLTLLTSCVEMNLGLSENSEWDPDHSKDNSHDKDAEHPEQKKKEKPGTNNTLKSPDNQADKSLNKADKKGAGTNALKQGAQPKSLAALDAIDSAQAAYREVIQIGDNTMDVFTNEKQEKYYFKNKKHKKSNKRTYLTDEELSHVQKKRRGSASSKDTARSPERRPSHDSSHDGSVV